MALSIYSDVPGMSCSCVRPSRRGIRKPLGTKRSNSQCWRFLYTYIHKLYSMIIMAPEMFKKHTLYETESNNLFYMLDYVEFFLQNIFTLTNDGRRIHFPPHQFFFYHL